MQSYNNYQNEAEQIPMGGFPFLHYMHSNSSAQDRQPQDTFEDETNEDISVNLSGKSQVIVLPEDKDDGSQSQVNQFAKEKTSVSEFKKQFSRQVLKNIITQEDSAV
jgi:hypothetical protein